ncbi:hypothetical protein HDU98_007430 [Podochytrium sp. JEL0797]|nr:hypothetical protein HDU98_007430 [Podochytrium sp. JEL0797]
MAWSKKRIVAFVWVALKVVVVLHLYLQWVWSGSATEPATPLVNPVKPVNAIPMPSDAASPKRPSKIPGIIHQSWKTTQIPKEFKQWSASWTFLNPSYEYKLWSDIDNRNLIAEHYAWFLPTFDSYAKPICKADAVRAFYLHRYGGVYSDLDVIPLRPMDELLGDSDLVLARMEVPAIDPNDPDTNWYYANQIPNAWMASKPGHPFWLHVAKLMMTLAEEKREMPVEERTGPIVIYRAYYEYQETIPANPTQDSITLADPHSIFPYSWSPTSPKDLHKICSQQSPDFDQVKCRSRVDPDNTSFAISYWSHSWDKKRSRYLFWRLLGY